MSHHSPDKALENVADSMLIQLLEIVRVRESGHLPNLSSTEKIQLKLTWDQFVQGDNAKTGFEMFLKMFKSRPETQSIFTFASGSSAAQMQNSSRLLFHVTRVVKYISKVIDHLDNLEEMVPLLKELGGRHGVNGYKVPPTYFPYLGEAMRALMREKVGTYNEKVDKAWIKIFNHFIIEMITIGQNEYGHRVMH